ncbi:MAG: hypothetical protein KatS3mg043_1293 [Rhodothermaceae bacterium]|nr:MAG: hypothetical protein KatS3mg043_1293 [Rhodothermaceae bacterium]
MWLVSLCFYEAGAQQAILGLPTSLDDPAALQANPALISFHRPKVVLGAQGYYVGLSRAETLPLRQGYTLLSLPYMVGDWLGMGVHAQYFDSPVYKRLLLGSALAWRLLRGVSLGVSASAYHVSYNEEAFVEVDMSDPVFAGGTSKETFTAAVGFFAQVLPGLHLAGGVRHLNEPNLSLVGAPEGVEPRSFFGGISYALAGLRAHVVLTTGRRGLEPQVALEAYSTQGSYVRLGGSPADASGFAEGQLYLGGPLSVNYRYQLPVSDLTAATSGSHRLTLVFEFGRVPRLLDPVSPPGHFLEVTPPDLDPAFVPRVYLASREPYLEHFEKRVERTIDPRLSEEALRSLTAEDLVVLDSSTASRRRPIPTEPVERLVPGIRLVDLLSDTYQRSLQLLGDGLKQDSTLQVAITGFDEGVVKAMGLRNWLLAGLQVQASQISVEQPDSTALPPRPLGFQRPPASESLTVLNPEVTTIYVLAAYADPTRDWELTVHRDDGAIVKRLSGSGTLPQQIEWDWRDDRGRALEAGVYRYRLTWRTPEGVQYVSNEQAFYVRKVVRKIHVYVTQDPATLSVPADLLEIRLNDK